MRKKYLLLAGFAIGFAFVIVGILSLAGALGGDAHDASSAPSYYDSGYGKFGADYYTYSVNNSAAAASAARTTAGNVAEIAKFLTTFCGLSSILIGLLVMCGFALALHSGVKETAEPLEETIHPATEATTTEEASVEYVDLSGIN